MQIETRPGIPSDLDRASQVLGEAFADYAWTRWTVDADDHLHRVTELQRIALQHQGFASGQVWVGAVDGRVCSVAVWMDSAVMVPSTIYEQLHPVIAQAEGSRHEASVAAEREIQGWRPNERHYYLATIGTIPAMQNRGIARAVLTPVITSADDDGVCAFLETSSARNLAFYSRFGFEVVDHRRISGGGPDVWAMLREPQADAQSRDPRPR
jgi:ribosomal protein S18 acetylase RimI-like enzyme